MPPDTVHMASRLSVAPMMDWTDRHCRFFHRQISRHALLYTEMVTAPALVRGGAEYLLEFHADEHPVALQLGGSDPQELAQAARMGAGFGYDEINLNVGCPSDRVQSGTFGAVLMRTPDLVARCVEAMKEAVDIPVTVKCRIGVDDQRPEEVLPDFISQVANAGCDYLIVHARKAWLQGLSPKENRDIPPLDYPLVYRMKQDHPELGNQRVILFTREGENLMALARKKFAALDQEIDARLGKNGLQNLLRNLDILSNPESEPDS